MLNLEGGEHYSHLRFYSFYRHFLGTDWVLHTVLKWGHNERGRSPALKKFSLDRVIQILLPQ